jgi:hypothetical protein
MKIVSATVRMHTCDECHRREEWTDSWRWFGSIKDLDNGTTKKFCSESCAVAWTERTGAEADDMSTPQNPY